MQNRKVAFFLIFFLKYIVCPAQTYQGAAPDSTSAEIKKNTASAQEEWVETTFQNMSQQERIGQLFMATAYSNLGSTHIKQIESFISSYHIGGLIFMQGGPARQLALTNYYQSLAKTPLLIAMDAEYGLGMRLDSTITFPRQMTLGAIADEKYIYEMGGEIARQLRRLGVQVNFAPVADVNNNPENPVIGTRSFGENKENVARKAIAYMKGLQHNGVIATAKHFPGHGDTNTDSHYGLPLISFEKERLENIELYPFRQMIKDTLMSTMVAHLHIPALDNTNNLPTTLSDKVVTQLLQEDMQFKGLIFTDALNMQGITKFYGPEETALKALLAGNDILLSPTDVAASINAIAKALENGTLPQEFLEKKVKKILKAKFSVGLHRWKPLPLTNLHQDLNPPRALALKARLYEQAITIAKNEDNLIPLVKLEATSFASVGIGSKGLNLVDKYLNKYAEFDNQYIWNHFAAKAEFDKIFEKIKQKDVVVVNLHGLSQQRSKNYGITASVIDFLERLEETTNLIVVVYGNPYSLKFLQQFKHVVCAYEDNALVHQAVPQVLFGAISNHGLLPVSPSETLTEGTGFPIKALGRLGFSLPEEVGMNSHHMAKIDSIAQWAIDNEATPGCQVVVAKDGKIVWEKAYGFQTYEKKRPIDEETLYDLASITKVIASLPAIMWLEERSQLSLDSTLGSYLPEVIGSNKEYMTLKEILSHQAGLLAFIPFWSQLVKKDGYDPNLISLEKTVEFPLEISAKLNSSPAIADSILNWCIASRLNTRRGKVSRFGYLYSDMGYYFFQAIIERKVQARLNEFMSRQFYEPLGLQTFGYLPLQKFPKERIAPTELDVYYRDELVWGKVHDPDAALKGGVAGHAGVFGNARDLATMMQMFLQDGYYGGKQYLQRQTLEKFNTQYFTYNDNRRALGWDKPVLKGSGGPTSDYASQLAFGHSGFTGTCTWVDPKHNLVYVFLSNRVHPTANNRKLIRENIRTKIQDVIYESIFVVN